MRNLMSPITRRTALQGSFFLATSLLVPWRSSADSLTKVDRILLKCVGCDVLAEEVRASSRLSRIQVHPLIKSRMSLDFIDDVEVEVVDLTKHWRSRETIVYYQASYAGPTRNILPNSWESGPRDGIDWWVEHNYYLKPGVPYDYTRRKIQWRST